MNNASKRIIIYGFLFFCIIVSGVAFLKRYDLLDLAHQHQIFLFINQFRPKHFLLAYFFVCIGIMLLGYFRFFNEWMKKALLLCSVYFLCLCFFIVGSRVHYPFELEWMESETLGHIAWVLSGHALYGMPSLEFTPSIYPPFYFYFAALVSKMTALDFLHMRILSFSSFLGLLFLIYSTVKRETRSIFYGVVAACFFTATYEISGAWFDLARVDMLFIFFLFLGLYLFKFYSSRKSYVLAAVFIWLSFLTKQTTLFIIVPVLFFVAITNRKAAVYFVGAVIALIGSSIALLDYIYRGWFHFYVFYMPSQHPVIQKMYGDFWTRDIFWLLPVACIVSIFYFLGGFAAENRKTVFFYFFTLIGALAGSWISRLHAGGYSNVLIPAYAVLSILFGLGMKAFLDMTNEAFGRQTKTKRANALVTLFLFLCAGQFIFLSYKPSPLIPTRNDLRAGDELLNLIKGAKGNVFIPCHSYLPALVGKSAFAHSVAIHDILRSGDVKAKAMLLNDMDEALKNHKFDMIILDTVQLFHMKEIFNYYQKMGRVHFHGNAFLPVTGVKTVPEYIYVPKTNKEILT